MFVCKICGSHSQSLRVYASHYKFHRNTNKAAFPCALKGCFETFSTYNNFARHVATRHSDERQSLAAKRYADAAVKLSCNVSLCHEQCLDFSEFIRHLKQHLGTGSTVTCPYRNCNKVFKLKSSFFCSFVS